jgi:putative heme transporter
VRDDALTPQASTAPVSAPHRAPTPDTDEEMPRVGGSRRRMVAFAVFMVCSLAFLYFVLPRLAGLQETWNRINSGEPGWLAVAAGFEVLSFGGYILLFRTVFVRGSTRIEWRESYQITMAGLAASRLFAAAGAGGVALTAWALRRSGMEARMVACRMVAFMSLLYVVFMGTLVVDGVLLRTGVFPGPAPLAFTVIPAALGATAIAVFLGTARLPADFERRLEGWSHRRGFGRLAGWARRAASAPAAVSSGVRDALALIGAREPGVLGAVAWWGFDIAVLWACFHAFGDPPSKAVIVMAYFVGMLANVLPLPGGIGGVDGGMIGSFIAFGVPAGLAVVAVLAYRAFAFWLPTIPGAVAYFQLRRTVSRWQEERGPGAAATARAT